ncbi:hypothetical protein C5N14_27185 [Micromonospora sp. MW-13]|nr:hypothetical protein C5N14_27185 [Micromonospora sp. MW-13]
MDRVSAHGAMSCPVSAADRGTESMPPRPEIASSPRLRATTSRIASGRLRAPAAHAAAISPCEWPTTASGSIPHAFHSRARDTMTENRAGWTTSTRSSGGAPGACRSASSSDQSTSRDSSSAHCRIPSRKAGDDSSRSSAIPTHCEPWPGKT